MVSGPSRQRNGRPVPCSKHRHLPACFAGVRLVRQGVRLNISAQSWREPTLMYPVIWVLRSSQTSRDQIRDHLLTRESDTWRGKLVFSMQYSRHSLLMINRGLGRCLGFQQPAIQHCFTVQVLIGGNVFCLEPFLQTRRKEEI